MPLKTITIIGGGLAGLTLGIGLRQRNFPVIIREAGHYPRHRVCGEFVSGRGQETLGRLGLRELLKRNGATTANTAAFFSSTKSSAVLPLPSSALCLSRLKMDAALAQEFQRLGGELLPGERYRERFGEGVVRATGRRAEADEKNCHWFGLKVHARDVTLIADLELHVSSRGYVGLCRLADGEVNVCGLFRRESNPGKVRRSCDWLRGESGSPLEQRLAKANFDDASFCAVAGLSLHARAAISRGECSLGDAITIIPPFTGNGMSMAFESAEMALEPLASWSTGAISWRAAQTEIARRCDRAFGRRLIWANWLQWFMLAPKFRNSLLTLTRHAWLWRKAFEQTR